MAVPCSLFFFFAHQDAKWQQGVTQFSDMTEEEFARYRGFDKHAWRKAAGGAEQGDLRPLLGMPSSFDWRDEGKVSPVKNQGSCGSCWAFSGVGAIEASLLINNQTNTSLSEQQYVDCAPNPDHCGGTGGCQGSTQPQLFAFAMTDGAMLESDYQYTAATGTCHEADYTAVASIDGYGIVPSNAGEAVLKSYLLKYGPIAVSVDASKWSGYGGGVFTYADCGTDIDHAVLLVGYGTDAESGLDYWTIKNSWGDSWGESGFIRISREDGFATDSTPQDGTGCDDGPDSVQVRGTCGIYYANSYVYGAKLVH